MKQSERIRMYRAYINHPLKESYEKEKKDLKKNCMKNDKILKHLIIGEYASGGLAVLLGIVFFSTIMSEVSDWTLAYIIFGIINLFFCIYFVPQKINDRWNELDSVRRLKKEYMERGLHEVDDPFRKECGEYNDDGEFVCSATQSPLSFEERQWCQTKGNCNNCARFLRCMGFNVDDWSEERRSEIQKW